jgi:hypothetical protein
MSSVKINPKGSLQHNHMLRAKIINCPIDQLERLFGDRHDTGEENKSSAQWYLVTEHGTATIRDYWALNEGELVVEYFRQQGIQAYCLYGEMT